MKMIEPFCQSILMKDFIYGLDDNTRREAWAKYVTSVDEAVAVALIYEEEGENQVGFSK